MTSIKSSGKLRWPFLGLAFAVAAVVSGRLICLRHQQPQSLDDVLLVARNLRLFVRGDGPNGALASRLILSETNPDAAETLCVPVVHTHCAQTQGRVAVYLRHPTDWESPHAQSENAAVWGRYFVYGDANLIRRLLKHE